ncbi:MAG: hypothetical protein IPL78_26155 [Chloroflexi bacterium]|nr:hypothetical protein [Chloroflexota bacterium]
MTTDNRAYLGNLHRLLDQYFDLEDVRSLCVDLGVDYDSVRGEGKSARVRELIVALARNGRLKNYSPWLKSSGRAFSGPQYRQTSSYLLLLIRTPLRHPFSTFT